MINVCFRTTDEGDYIWDGVVILKDGSEVPVEVKVGYRDIVMMAHRAVANNSGKAVDGGMRAKVISRNKKA